MRWKIPLFKIYWDEEDVVRVTETIRSGMNWATGPNVQEFERLFSEYVGTTYAVAFNSGTSALHAILAACGIGNENEVIVPSFTFIATANAPLFVRASPVFADVEETTWGLDPEDAQKKISSKTKAILPIHYGGCPCRIQELKQIAKKHNLLLIEDAAQSLGAKTNNARVGTFGDAAIFSFCAPKIITTGEGGAVVTDSTELYESLKLVRSHGRVQSLDYFSSSEYQEYVTFGYNFRMSNITAALGVAQLKKVDRIIKMRRRNAERMSTGLSQIAEIEVPYAPDDLFHVYQLYTIRVKAQGKRDALAAYLTKKGIMTKVYFHPIHTTHFYKNKLEYHCELPITEKLSKQVLTLPMYPTMTENEIDYIVHAIAAFFSQK